MEGGGGGGGAEHAGVEGRKRGRREVAPRLDGSERTVTGWRDRGRGRGGEKEGEKTEGKKTGERGAKRENRAFSVFWLEGKPRGNMNGGEA